MKLLKKPPLRVLLFSLLSMLAVAVTGTAQKQPQNVEVRIGAILASNQSDEFDARLKGLEKQLRVLKYRSYRLLKDESQNIPWQWKQSFRNPRRAVADGCAARVPRQPDCSDRCA